MLRLPHTRLLSEIALLEVQLLVLVILKLPNIGINTIIISLYIFYIAFVVTITVVNVVADFVVITGVIKIITVFICIYMTYKNVNVGFFLDFMLLYRLPFMSCAVLMNSTRRIL